MTTISVPITGEQEKFINDLVKSGKAANKAHAVRRALDKMAEDEALESIRRSEEDIRQGRVYYGDLDKIVKKLRKYS